MSGVGWQLGVVLSLLAAAALGPELPMLSQLLLTMTGPKRDGPPLSHDRGANC